MDEKNVNRFKDNLERFAFFSKEDAKLFNSMNCSSVSFYTNDNGELNLQIKNGDDLDYVYSKESIKAECLQWFLNLRVENTKVLYVFGVGLGNYYEVCQDWLRKDPTRFLIFLEDNKEIIYHFLQTENAEKILHDKQVRLQYIDQYAKTEGQGIDGLTTAFLFDPYRFTSLVYYSSKRSKFLNDLTQFFSHSIHSKQTKTGEFLTGGGAYFTNYYNNLKFLPDSYFANAMFDKFKNTPAIICGAGPSLEKNIHLLKTLGDKALIIAGGSATNALNSYNVFPHFTAGIDPNPSQLMRLLSNNAYETPFFYRNRIYTEALGLNSGSKLYMTGAGGYEIHKWIEKKLGMGAIDSVDEGHNIVNFSVSIAKKLGCNPIILCGVDLAYTNNQSYLPGIKFHALHNFKKSFITKNAQDEVIGFKDVDGNSTTTLWKWVNEASWYSYFAELNPSTKLINATEGGIGFPNIQNMTLTHVASKYLEKTYDFESLIHGEIQNSPFPHEIQGEDVLKVMKLLRKHLGGCEVILKNLLEEYFFALRTLMGNAEASIESNLKKIQDLKEKLTQNEFYTYILKRFLEVHVWVFEKRSAYFIYDLEKDSKQPVKFSKLELELDGYKFLKSVLKLNKDILEKAIKNYPRNEIQKDKKKKTALKTPLKTTRPIFDGEKQFEFYPNHMVKTEQYLKNDLREGPSTYYSQNGTILSSCWYEKGLREGRALFYYATGEVFSIRHFRHGLSDGTHEFYYKDGSLKSRIQYKNGVLHGEVLLYYKNHELKRELHFKDGKRDGVERMWNEQGILIIEANYVDDKSLGSANWWYDNGVLKQTVKHTANFEDYEIQCFTEQGQEVPKAIVEGEDYFDKLIKITNTFMESIQDLFKQADLLVPYLEVKDADEVLKRKNMLEALKGEIGKLAEINAEIKKNFSGNAHSLNEPFWKSTALQEQIDEQLNGVIETMRIEIQAVQSLIIKAMNKVSEKIK